MSEELQNKANWVWAYLQSQDPMMLSMLAFIDIRCDGTINFVTHKAIKEGYDPDDDDMVLHRTEIDLSDIGL